MVLPRLVKTKPKLNHGNHNSDESDQEDLIMPEPQGVLLREFAKVIDREDERFETVESETAEINID
jgi:hypothetical protein